MIHLFRTKHTLQSDSHFQNSKLHQTVLPVQGRNEGLGPQQKAETEQRHRIAQWLCRHLISETSSPL